MSKRLCVLIVLAMTACACAQPTDGEVGEQVFQRLDEVDPNQIATDPESGQLLLVQFVRVPCPGSVKVHGRVRWHVAAGIPEAWIGEPNTPLVIDPNTGDFSFETSSDVPVIQYFTVGLRQVNGKERQGTYAVAFFDPPAPVLIGLPPTITSAAVVPRQRAVAKAR